MLNKFVFVTSGPKWKKSVSSTVTGPDSNPSRIVASTGMKDITHLMFTDKVGVNGYPSDSRNWNLSFIFEEHRTFSDQTTSLSKACCCHICQLCCILPYHNSSTACTIATSVIYSKLYYCNSVCYRLPESKLSRLQQIQNSLACTVIKALKSCYITSILRSPLAQNRWMHQIQALT